ncbi:MAG: SIS domain-containing protein [Blautia sp.]|nr:SIS domain-containing protein [Blautia sp.]
MIVTDKNGNQHTADEGYEIWADQARRIQQETGGLMFFCGNGASETMAEHMSHDWFQNAQINTYTVSETSHITAISNDLSYEDVFAYRINRICSERDMLITISSSGNSPNVLKAIQAAREKGTFIVTVSGKEADNKSRAGGDLNFYVPLDTYGMVESAHAVLIHGAMDCFLDKYMGGRH